MPTCELVSGHFNFRDPADTAAYLQPLVCLGSIAKELTKRAYGTKCQIQAVAIVEEVDTQWWLVLGLASPQPMQNVKSYLRTRVPLDLVRMTTLTPWLQRRLGWGDARTTPELLEALKQLARG